MDKHKGKTILVVDDEPELAEIISDILTEAGYKVIMAHHGEAALKILRSGARIDMVFSDAKMPVMDGIALLKIFQIEAKHIPFCIVTGYASHTENQIRAMGAVGYLSKPFSGEALLRLAAEHLDASSPGVPEDSQDKTLVYVLEDEEIDRVMLQTAFNRHEFGDSIVLRFFAVGDTLIQALRAKDGVPDLLILDIKLPGMSGIEVLEFLRNAGLIPQSAKVIMLSSSKLESDRELSHSLGAQCMYAKPATRAGWWHLARAIKQSWIKRRTFDKAS